MTKLDALQLLVLDVDGVLTDGTFLLGDGDQELKAFHVRDGTGLALWRNAGLKTTFLSGRGGNAVRRRAQELGIERIWERVENKSRAFDEILDHFCVDSSQVACMGDDLQDLSVLGRAGFSAAPADAAPEVLRAVDLVVPSAGGRGAVRDLVEHVLRATGHWPENAS